MNRCVNLDWLEVHAYEPVETPHTADYFRSMGFPVHEREYGTRIYHEMFTLDDQDGQPLLEIRRNPKSTGEYGIHQINECHIRLHNRTCYYDNAAGIMREFLERYGYEFQRISRVDVCLDFIKFDKGDDPAKFVQRYLKHRYAKINQGRIHAHGDDEWNGQEWNSLSWGSPKSMVSTKMYCKTRELEEVKDKPYIRWSWYESGLVSDPINLTQIKPDGTTYKPDIWRVEFSVRSSVKKWFVVEQDGNAKQYRSYRNTLEMWDGREQLLQMFSSLSRHYFRFKKFVQGVRKDRCEDKILFDWSENPTFYHIERLPTITERSTELDRLIRKLENYRTRCSDRKGIMAIDLLLKIIHDEQITTDCYSVFQRDQIEAWRQTLTLRLRGNTIDPVKIYNELFESLRDKKLIFDD